MDLKLSRAALQGLLESTPDALVVVDRAGAIVLVNTQAERLFGYGRSELQGQSIDVLLPEQLRRIHEERRQHYIDDPHPRPMGVGLDLLARRSDGSEFQAEISLSPFTAGAQLLVSATVRDVSARKRLADELERQVQQRTMALHALVQFSGELLLARNIDEVLRRSLQHALALTGGAAQHASMYLYAAEQDSLLLRDSVGLELLPPAIISVDSGPVGRAFALIQRQEIHAAGGWNSDWGGAASGIVAQPLIARTTPLGVLVLVRCAGAGPFAVEALPTVEGLANLTAAAVQQEQFRSHSATLTTLVASLEEEQRHMTARLSTAEAGMVQAARLAAIGQLSASIAHEINNPLYAARGALELLEEDIPAEHVGAPYVALARDQLARIATIIERMRNFYRPQRGDFAAVDLNVLVIETLQLAELNTRAGAITPVLHTAPDLPPITGVADQLRQVFLNIILNAFDAMPDSGTLTIETMALTDTVVVSISDTGEGIAPDARSKLFEPFFTTKSHGTGLGLAISAHIMQLHQGRLDVDASASGGCVFHIIFPHSMKEVA